MKLSNITEGFTESVIREMTRICDAVDGDNLAQGFPDFPAPSKIKRAAREAIAEDRNQYPVTYGEPELRKAIADKAQDYNNIPVDPSEEITVTCGATEAMIATLKAVINPGDEIIVFEPFYENYGPDAILSGATPRYVSLERPDWSYSSDQLRQAFNERTKAIIINTPNNPTGKVFRREELREIADLCVEYDCLAITDEIYEQILYDGRTHVSMASLEGMESRTVTINSISKTYSVTGWRVGWALAEERITERIRKVHDFLTVGAPTPFQHAAVEALEMPEDYYAKLRADYHRRRESLYDALVQIGLGVRLPEGSYYVMAEASDLMQRLGVDDDFALSKKLVEIAGVAVVPGSSFYSESGEGESEIRFCFSKSKKTLRRVAKKLREL